MYTMKFNVDGAVERFNARLMTKDIQAYGIDYIETFVLLDKISTIQILLSLVVNLDWSLHQFDVKNNFLPGELSKKVYMELR